VTALHEQNAVLGRANRLLAPARRPAGAVSSRTDARARRRRNVEVVGNPVRPALAALAGQP
jgi:UDP-N-acetylglucosamine--N-acetylmuramyl-(pentapeptide) pyrophosphoryl-undecaprenol N-acetylglucosamine transferase